MTERGRFVLARHFAFSVRTCSLSVRVTDDFDRALGIHELRIVAFGNRGLGGFPNELVPGLATVPFLIGVERNIEQSCPAVPFGPVLIGFDNPPDEGMANDVCAGEDGSPKCS
jgi:hypothetical protein